MDLDTFKSLFATVRELGTSGTRQRGFVAFRGEAIQFDSSYEYEFLKRVATDPATIAIVSQPCRILWRDREGRLRRYVPDFAVLYRVGAERTAACVVEVKPLRFALNPKVDECSKYNAACIWASRVGASFGISVYCFAEKMLDNFRSFQAGVFSALELGVCITEGTVKQKRKLCSAYVRYRFTDLPKIIGGTTCPLKRLASCDSCGHLQRPETRRETKTVQAQCAALPVSDLLHHAMEWAEFSISYSESSEQNGRPES